MKTIRTQEDPTFPSSDAAILRRICLLLLVSLSLMGSISAFAVSGFTLENNAIRLIANSTGAVTSVYGKLVSTEYLMSSTPFVKARVGATWYNCTGCTSNGSTLEFTFPAAAGVSLILQVSSKSSHLYFEISSVSSNVDELVFLNFSVSLSKYRSAFSGIAADDTYCIFARSLSPTCTATVAPFVVTSKKEYGLVGAKFAVGGALYSNIRDTLKNVLTAEIPNIQNYAYNGPWALDAAINKLPYVWTYDISPANTASWVSVANSGKLGIILMTDWWQTCGHYMPRQTYVGGSSAFPAGISDMASVVSQIHVGGLKAGLRVLTMGINIQDSYITPIPDARLAKDASFTLSSNISATSTSIQVSESISNLDVIWGNKGNVLQIGNELIQYTGYTSAAPYTFTGCARGAFGTVASAHTAPKSVQHLYSRYSMFYPDPDSTLMDEIATHIANIVNTCKYDMVYLDGAEATPKEWYGVAKAKQLILSKIDHSTRVETSIWDHSSWHLASQIGALDFPYFALQRFVDMHCQQAISYADANLLPGQLGWWGLTPDVFHHSSLFPEELEYHCAKSLGTDLPSSFRLVTLVQAMTTQTSNGTTINGVSVHGSNGRQTEYLSMIKRYETLRLDNQISQSMRGLLTTPGYEFSLKDTQNGTFLPVMANSSKHKITGANDGTHIWNVNNDFSTQPAKMRIEALDAVGLYSSTNLALAGFQSDTFTLANALNVSSTFSWSTEQMTAGASGSAKFTAANSGTSRTGAWTRAKKTFSPAFDTQGNYALGFWIYGDGKGEIMNFELTNSPALTSGSEHIVTIDFVGWKYFEIPIRECDTDKYLPYTWPAVPANDYWRAAPTLRSSPETIFITELNIYLNNLPPEGQSVQCYISPIKVLPLRYANLSNTAVQIGSTQVTFPGNIQSRQYIEFNSMSDCKLYSKDGFFLQNITPQGTHPSLMAGDNTVTFTATPQSGYNVRANVSIFSNAAASSGMIAGWNFSQSGNSLADISGNNNLGTLLNGATQNLPGDWPSVSLDGINDYVTVPSNSNLKYQGGAMSLSAWVYLDPTETTGGYIMSKPWNGSGQYNYSLGFGSNRKPFFGVGYPSSTTINSGKSMRTSAWHSVVVTVDPSQMMSLYLNGKIVASGVYTSWQQTAGDQNLPLALGTLFPYSSGWAGNTAFSLDGKIGGADIFNRVLSAREISAMVGLIGYWNFDDSNTTATDASGNGNFGTLMNGATYSPVGNPGKSMSFDGLNDYLSAPAKPPLEFKGEELTMATWIYINPTETTGGYLISKPWNRSGEYNYLLGLTANRQIFLGVGFHWDWNNAIVTTQQVATGGWHHIAATIDSEKQVKVYIDGSVAASGSYVNWNPVSGNSKEALIFGSLLEYPAGWAGNTALSFDGKMDGIEMYSTKLSDDEITALATP